MSSHERGEWNIEPTSRASEVRPWYKKKRWILSLGFAFLFGVGQFADEPTDSVTPGASSPAALSAAPTTVVAQSEAVPGTSIESAPVATRSRAPRSSPTRKAQASGSVSKARAVPSAVATTKRKRVVVSKPASAPSKTRKPAATCDPNYSQACVPVDSDVDCAGGSGNGPSYFGGVAKVTGDDVYDLDRDGDGYACEP
jgi:hypothetical protein